jgi:hypothetical protein
MSYSRSSSRGATMRADLRDRLLAVARGDFSPELSVTRVSGVTEGHGYVSTPLKLQGLRGLRLGEHQPENHTIGGVTGPVTHATDLDDGISERPVTFQEEGRVPQEIREAWTRFTRESAAFLPAEIVKGVKHLLTAPAPRDFPPARWLNAVKQAIHFATAWAPLALSLGWTAEELFGLHPIAPDRRHDAKGLAFALSDGKCIVAITANRGVIRAASGAKLSFYRRPGPGSAILAWELDGDGAIS